MLSQPPPPPPAPTPERYQRSRIPILDGGVLTDKSPEAMQPNQSPSIVNLTLVGGILQVDTGYGMFGTFASGICIGTPQLCFQDFHVDGTSILFLVTTRTVYILNTTLNQWQVVQWLATTYSNTTQRNAGATTMVVSSAAGLAVGDVLGLPLDDGEQLAVTITILAGTTVTFAPAIPAGRDVPATSTILLGLLLAGAIGNKVVAKNFPANGWAIFTNGIDPLFYYDGSKLKSLVADSDLPAATTCRSLVIFHEQLYLLGTTENGTDLPQRVRASDQVNPLAWTPGSSSIAAIYDLLDTEDFVLDATIVGPYLVLFRGSTIMRASYLGVLNEIVFWEYIYYGEGLTAVSGWAQVGTIAEFVGLQGVWKTDASYQLASSGDAVFIGFLSAVGDLNPATKDTVFGMFLRDYNEFWLFYPANGASAPNKMLRHNELANAWYVRQFANQFVSASPYLPVVSVTWATAVGTWAQQTLAWNSRSFSANGQNTLLCASDTNVVYVYDYRTLTDGGTAIAWSLETMDIGGGDTYQRWDTVRAYCAGDGVLCEFSTDAGATWTTVGTFNFDGALPAMKILTFQAVSAYIRFRLSGTDPNFQFNWLEVWHLEETDWGTA